VTINLNHNFITLCGSTRFIPAFHIWNELLTSKGFIVYSVAMRTTGESVDPILKRRLDTVHKRKIMRSDAIFVLDIDGYIGDSTQDEITFARRHGKHVYFLSQEYPSWCFFNRRIEYDEETETYTINFGEGRWQLKLNPFAPPTCVLVNQQGVAVPQSEQVFWLGVRVLEAEGFKL
jgi:hypothetical protein